MRYPLVKILLDEGVKFKLISKALEINRVAYSDWIKKPKSAREIKEERILEVIKEIHNEDPGYGYRFISDELKEMGFKVSERTVWKICSKNQIFAFYAKKNKKYQRVNNAYNQDLVNREFRASEPNKIWLTDITEHHTKEGKLYWCGFKDVFSNMIVGSSWSDRMTSKLVISALLNSLHNRNYPKGVIIHSDRGSQYNSHIFQYLIKTHQLKQSMGQARTCADNSAMESFNSLLQKNVLNLKVWESREELGMKIDRWVSENYNSRRRQRNRNMMTPVEYDMVYNKIKLNNL